MKIQLNEEQILNILKVIRSERSEAKTYYMEHTTEEERIGITSPEEWKEIYNTILNQAQEQNEFTMLEFMK